MGGHSLYAGGYAAGYGQDMPYRGRAAAGGWEQDQEEEEEEYDEDDAEEPEDSSDSDYGSSRKKGNATKAAAARRPARTAAAKPRAGRAAGSSRAAAASGQKKRARKRAAYADDDEDSAEDTSDSDDESEPAGYGAGSRLGYGTAAAPARRPRRQAAAKANENIKHTYEDRNEFDDPDDDNALDEHAAAAAAPVPATQFAQYYAMAHSASHPLQQPQYDWQQTAVAAQNGGSWYQQQAEAAPVGDGSYAQEVGQEHLQQHVQGQQQVRWGHDSHEQQQDVEQEQPQHVEQEQHWQHDHVQQKQQDGEQDMYDQEDEQQQQQQQQPQHPQQWQRSPDPPSPQHWQSVAAQQPYAVPSPAPRHSSASLAASKAAGTSRPGAQGMGRSASAATAATTSRRPSRAAATVKPSYYEGSDDSADEEEAGADYMDYVSSSSSSGTDEDSGAESGSGDDVGSDGDVDADYQYALQMQEKLNGMRARPTRQRQATRRDSLPSVGRKRGAPGRASEAVKRRRTRTAANKVSYAESGDSSDDSEARAAAAAARREPLPALEDTGDGWEAEGMDEVERVLGHRVAAANGDASANAGAGGAVAWSDVEFHVKWRRLSFIHTSWQPLEALRDLPGFKRVLNYMKRVDAATANRAQLTREEVELIDVAAEMEQQLLQQYTQVERVIAERPGQSRSLLVKWQGLPYCEATWEAAEDVMAAQGGPEARDDFLTRQQCMQETARGADAARNAAIKSAAGASLELQEQPAFLSAGKLRDYQLEGLNWLTYAWLKDRNAILADEMGLGKTIQCVSLVGLLAQHMNVRGPFLVVVPLSTVPNWIKEFRKWAPMVNAVVYVGDGRSREVIRAFEFPGAPSNRSRPYGFEAIITTYELVLKDAALLRQIPWAYLLVDEAHRLKNSESALYQELSTWNFKNKLLVTGTPLQNSMRELWALLNFLEPGRFGAAEEFEAAYRVEGAAMSSLSSLHSSLKPHLLRRVIKDVETSLPPKTERILRVEMTPLQRQYYKWILSRNFKELNKGARGQVSLLNIITELKKACNHPFLFESAEDEYRLSDEHTSAVDRLVRTSGKMVLLDKLMRRLRETGHRVLIFSQMVRVLDIISDYLRLRGYPHQRLDGSTPAAARHAAMEAFNRPDSPDFAFLLSTRAGGLGINLATADTVIIFDSDWNPQNDLQAMSRAHRIGQTETVNIYRFVTSGSVEEEILERAKRKMVLDHLVIQRMDTSGRTVLGPAADSNGKKMFGKDELAAILRFGAEDLFKAAEEGSAERSRQLLEEDIDDILSRAEVVTQQPGQQSVAGGASDLLSSFNVATFKNEEDDATFWSRLIAEPDRPHDDLTAPLAPRAARTKQQQQVDSKSASPPPQGSRQLSQQYSDDVPAGGGGSRPKAKKARRAGGGSSRASDKPGAPVEGAVLRIDQWPLEPAKEGKARSNTRGLSKREAAAFVRAVRRYGLQSRLSDVASEVGGAVEAAGAQAQQLLWDELVQGCRRALELAAEQDKQQGQLHDPREVTLDFFGCAVKASEFSQHLAAMDLVATQVNNLQSSGQAPCVAFRLEAGAVPAPAKWGKALGWTPRDDAALLLGVFYHGLGHWEAVVADARLGLQAKLGGALGAGGSTAAAGHEDDASGAAQVVPKASHLETRVLGILRKMLLMSGQPVRANSRPRGGHKGHKAAAGAGAPSAGAEATAAAAVAAAAASAAERKAAKKAAARRAAALAAAGITGERNTPTPPPPPVHKQPPIAGKQLGGRQLGPVGARPRLPEPKRSAKPPSRKSAENAAAVAAAAAAAAKREKPAAKKEAGATGVQPVGSKRPEGSNASTAPPQAGNAGTAATAGEGSRSANGAIGSKAASASAHGPAASRAMSPFATAAAAGGSQQDVKPVPPPRPPPPPPLPNSPPPEQQQQQQEASAAPRPPPPAAGMSDGVSEAAAVAAAAPGPAAAGKPTGSRQVQPKTAAIAAAAAAHTASKLPQLAPAAPGAKGRTRSDQELQAVLSGVSSEMQGLLQLNASAAAGEEQEDQHQVVRLTKAYLLAIGLAVEQAAAAAADTEAGGVGRSAPGAAAAAGQSGLEQQLWAYVVKKVQTPMSQQQFAAVCKKLVRKNTAAAAAAAAAGGLAKGSSSTQLPALRVATAPVAGQHGRHQDSEQLVPGAALTPGKDPPLYGVTGGGTAFGGWEEQQQEGSSRMQYGQEHGQQQQQQQQQRQQDGELVEGRRAGRAREGGSREHSGERGRLQGRGEARRSSSRSRSSDRGRVAGSSRDRASSGDRRLPGTGSGRRSRSSSRDRDRGRSRSSSRDRGKGRDSRSSSRDRGRDRARDSDRNTGRSRSAERYNSRGYRQRQHYSLSYRQYRSYSRSRDRQQYDSSRYRGRQRSRSRSHSRSRRRSRSYDRGRGSRQYSRSRSRGHSRSPSRGRSHSRSRDRRRSLSRDRDRYRGTDRGRDRGTGGEQGRGGSRRSGSRTRS